MTKKYFIFVGLYFLAVKKTQVELYFWKPF